MLGGVRRGRRRARRRGRGHGSAVAATTAGACSAEGRSAWPSVPAEVPRRRSAVGQTGGSGTVWLAAGWLPRKSSRVGRSMLPVACASVATAHRALATSRLPRSRASTSPAISIAAAGSPPLPSSLQAPGQGAEAHRVVEEVHLTREGGALVDVVVERGAELLGVEEQLRAVGLHELAQLFVQGHAESVAESRGRSSTGTEQLPAPAARRCRCVAVRSGSRPVVWRSSPVRCAGAQPGDAVPCPISTG